MSDQNPDQSPARSGSKSNSDPEARSNSSARKTASESSRSTPSSPGDFLPLGPLHPQDPLDPGLWPPDNPLPDFPPPDFPPLDFPDPGSPLPESGTPSTPTDLLSPYFTPRLPFNPPPSPFAPLFDPDQPNRRLDHTGRAYIDQPSGWLDVEDEECIQVRLSLTFLYACTTRQFRRGPRRLSLPLPMPADPGPLDVMSGFPYSQMPMQMLAQALERHCSKRDRADFVANKPHLEPFDPRPPQPTATPSERALHNIYLHPALPETRRKLETPAAKYMARLRSQIPNNEDVHVSAVTVTTFSFPLTGRDPLRRERSEKELNMLLKVIRGEGYYERYSHGFAMEDHTMCDQTMTVHVRRDRGQPLTLRETKAYLATVGMFEPALDALRPFGEDARLLPLMLRDWRTLTPPEVARVVNRAKGWQALRTVVGGSMWDSLRKARVYAPREPRTSETPKVAPVEEGTVCYDEVLRSLDFRDVYWWAIIHALAGRFARECARAEVQVSCATKQEEKQGWRRRAYDMGEELCLADLEDMIGLWWHQNWTMSFAGGWERCMGNAKRELNAASAQSGFWPRYPVVEGGQGMYSHGADFHPERWTRPAGVHVDGMDIDS